MMTINSFTLGHEYWYDGQIRRYLEQFIKAFSGFQYVVGNPPQLLTVPVKSAVSSRQVANILRNNSDNSLLSVPMITVFMSGLVISRERTQSPSFVDTFGVDERKIDPTTGKYTSAKGNTYTVERIMPMPYVATMQIDIWTSNQSQKHQLMEQILASFNPGFDIQNSDNALDWTALTTATLEDIVWSSVQMPIGTESEIDVGTLTFKLPIWISPPAKVKKQTRIEEIVANIMDGSGQIFPNDNEQWLGYNVSGTSLSQNIITPGNHQIQISGGNITLLNAKGGLYDENDTPYVWQTLVEQYGALNPGVSKLYLITSGNIDNTANEIIGTIQYDANNPNILFWQIDSDTLPSNTLPPIKAIINPLQVFPGNKLTTPVNGDRYLILNDIAPNTMAWGTLSAKANSIIQYNNGVWVVSYDPTVSNSVQFVLNLFTSKQLKWIDDNWIMAIDGEYHEGYWRLSL